MNELTRMKYLDAMGVATFVPRFRLSNAAASVQAELPKTDIQPRLPAQSVNQAHTVLTAEQSLHNDAAALAEYPETPGTSQTKLAPTALDLVEKAGPKQGPTEPSLSSKIGSSASEPSSVADIVAASGLKTDKDRAKFSLNLWFTDTSVQILDTRELDDALPTQSLLSNILLANGLLKGQLAAAESQCWPLPGGHHQDRSWSAAFAMFSAFFDARFQQKPLAAFVCFGGAAAKAVLGDELERADFDPSSHSYTTIHSQRYAKPVIVLPALRDFLYQPQLKRHIWPALSTLRAALR